MSREVQTRSEFSLDKRACVEVLHDGKQYGLKNHFKKMHKGPQRVGFMIPRTTGWWRQLHSFSPTLSQQGKSFRWNKACGRPKYQLNVNRVGYNCIHYVCTKASALVCLYVSSVYRWEFLAVRWLCDGAWCRNKVAVYS